MLMSEQKKDCIKKRTYFDWLLSTYTIALSVVVVWEHCAVPRNEPLVI